MVKVKEFGCGCSLRTGTLIIAWILLTYSCLLLSITSVAFFYLCRRSKNSRPFILYELPSVYIFEYNLVRTITGVVTSVLAIWALQTNKAKYLNGLFWYLCYMVIVFMISEILMIVQPNWQQKLDELNPTRPEYTNIDEIVFYFLMNLFVIGLLLYFALVVKSCREYALRNEAQDVRFVGPDMTTIGYIRP